jgi:hypothetical protein
MPFRAANAASSIVRSVLLLAGLALPTAACVLDLEGEVGGVEAERVELPSSEPIVHGVPASGYPEAVLVDSVRWGKPWRCVGAVIAPKVVLTAGHCVVGVSSSRITAPFAKGQKANGVKFLSFDWKDTSGYIVPDQHDVALIVLDAPIQLASYPKVASTQIPDGTLALNVGRIQNGDASKNSLFVSQPLALRDGTPSGWKYNYLSAEVIQSGDSGGPVVLEGAAPHTIVAVNSASGNGTQFLARVDLLADWIAGHVAAVGTPPAPEPASPACVHPVCKKGAPLAAACDPCAAAICAADAYCCTSNWDHICVKAVAQLCGGGC